MISNLLKLIGLAVIYITVSYLAFHIGMEQSLREGGVFAIGCFFGGLLLRE